MRAPPFTLTAAALLLPSLALATMVVPLDLPTLTARAEQVALVRVESQAAHFTADKQAIYTDVALRITEPIKGGGGSGDLVTVRREGGEVDGLGMKVIGAAAFETGEESLVFLEHRGSTLWTVGMAQGRMKVALVNGRRSAIRSFGGADTLGKVPAEPRVRVLDDLVHDLRDLVARARKSP